MVSLSYAPATLYAGYMTAGIGNNVVINGNFTDKMNAVTPWGASGITLGSGTYTITIGSNAGMYSNGNITGAGGLAYLGTASTSSVNLGGSCTYTGPTTFNGNGFAMSATVGGKLGVAGSVINVINGAILTGYGTVNGNLNVTNATITSGNAAT